MDLTKTVFAIATTVQVADPGVGWVEEQQIQRQSGYGEGPFPPCFTSRSAAEAALAKLSPHLRPFRVVVELELREESPGHP